LIKTTIPYIRWINLPVVFHGAVKQEIRVGCLQTASLATEFGVKEGSAVLFAGPEVDIDIPDSDERKRNKL
jgi:hypothetical protein